MDDNDLSPELALVRAVLAHSEDLKAASHLVDTLFALVLAATHADRLRWTETVAPALGATRKRPLDSATWWDASAVVGFSPEDRLAWVAEAVHELAESYYGMPVPLSTPVHGEDAESPGGLLRALLTMRQRAAEL